MLSNISFCDNLLTQHLCILGHHGAIEICFIIIIICENIDDRRADMEGRVAPFP